MKPTRLVLALNLPSMGDDHCGRQNLVGGLAGAVQLLHNNAVVLSWAQREQKSLVDEKAKSSIDFDFQ